MFGFPKYGTDSTALDEYGGTYADLVHFSVESKKMNDGSDSCPRRREHVVRIFEPDRRNFSTLWTI